jgi:nitric oxide reductase NorD protein
MAEPEELIVDAARHVVVATRRLFQRHRAPPPRPLPLSAVAVRLDLMVTAVLGRSLPLRVAQPAAHPTWLARAFQRERFPQALEAVPATDGASIWLPRHLGVVDVEAAAALYRAMALQQARRAERGSVRIASMPAPPLVRAVAHVLEAHAAEVEVARALPGLVPALLLLRRRARLARPALSLFAPARQPLEHLLRAFLDDDDALAGPPWRRSIASDPAEAVVRAQAVVASWQLGTRDVDRLGPSPLFLDLWTGALLRPDDDARTSVVVDETDPRGDNQATRSARMTRRPEARAPDDGDDPDDGAGAFMVQQDQPHEACAAPATTTTTRRPTSSATWSRR